MKKVVLVYCHFDIAIQECHPIFLPSNLKMKFLLKQNKREQKRLRGKIWAM